MKKNINKGCYAWLILQKSAIIRQKTTEEEVLYEKSYNMGMALRVLFLHDHVHRLQEKMIKFKGGF